MDELYAEAAIEEQTIDLFHAMSEVNEFLRTEIDIGDFNSNRQRKMFERNPVAFLAKKMRDSEVVISKLPPDERQLFSRAKAMEVESFLRNEAVRKCLDDAEVWPHRYVIHGSTASMDSGRIGFGDSLLADIANGGG